MTAFPAHIACAALVGADMAARAVRIRLLAGRLGARLSVADAIRLNLLGDAAAELTPFRLAGEPSRVAAMLQSGVAAGPAILAVGSELLLSYGMMALLVVVAAWSTVPAWLSSAGPAVAAAVARVPLWALAALLLTIVVSLRLMSRLRAGGEIKAGAGLRSSLRMLAGIGPRQIAAVLALTAVNVAARVGILWMLVSTLPDAPPARLVLVGSFILLFGQAFAPTPSGLGVVELGFIGGAAGPLDGHAVSLLIYWRLYTAILPIALAAIFALPRYGTAPLVRALRRHRERTSPAALIEQPAPPVLS